MAAMDVQVRIRAIDQFSNTLDKLQRKLRGLDGAKGGLGANDGLGVAYSRRADRLAKSVANAEQRHAAASQSSGVAGGMPAFGLPAGLIGGAALGVGLQKTVSAAADFESSLTGIQKKSGATNEQMKAIGEEIKQIATDGSLAVSIDEIAAGYERGAAGGIPLNELREFAVLSAKASDAFEMSASDVANAAAGFNKVLGVPMTEMERMFDLINGLADAGIADESGIVDYMDRAGAMSKTFGLTAQETAAIGAALANLKVPAERASTAMNSVLTKLLAPNALSGDAREALGRLVGDFDKFGRSIKKDASGTLVGLLKQLKELDSISRTEIIAELFGQDHLDVVSQMVEGLDEVEQNLKYAAGQDWFGSLEGSYKLKLDDFWSQWQIVKNAMQRLMIDAGNMGMPVLKSALEGAIGIIAEINEGLKSFEARVDWTSVEEAKGAVADLAQDFAELLGLDVTNSSILQFFRDLAEAVNNVSAGITATKGFIEYLNDPMGLNTKEGRRIPEPETGDGWFEKYRRESVRPDSPLDKALGFLGGWMDEADRRHEAAAPKRPADDLNIKPEDTMPAMRTGRLRPAPYDPFAEGRVPDAAATPAPEMDPAMLERMRQRAQIAPPAANSVVPANPIPAPPPNLTPTPAATLPDISSVPIPVSRPEIDTSAFLQGTSAIEAAKAGIATPVMATADMNIAPLLSKVEQAKAAVRSLDAMSATVGSGNGGNFEARVNDQF